LDLYQQQISQTIYNENLNPSERNGKLTELVREFSYSISISNLNEKDKTKLYLAIDQRFETAKQAA
jgi:hypothetical protein